MNIFLDTLNTETIKEFYDMGVLFGVTTNPTLAKRFGMADDVDMINQIRHVMPKGEIHVEAFGKTSEEIVGNALRLKEGSSDDDLVFKVPFSPEGVAAVKKLRSLGHKTNLHLIFSKTQALISSCVESTYICPLVGRLDDIGHNAFDNLSPVICSFKYQESKTSIMVSSVRHVQHVISAFESGADAVTIPENVLRSMFNHPLTDVGYEKFHKDLRSMETVSEDDVRGDLVVECKTSLRDCLSLLTEKKASCLAITDKDRILAGVFTLGDLKRILSDKTPVSMESPIRDLMNKDPVVVEITETYGDVNIAFSNHNIGDLVVVDSDRVVGVLSCNKI